VGRMEAGEDLQSIEKRMEEMGLGDEMGGAGDDGYNFA